MSKASEIAASMQFINEELNEESQVIEEKLASGTEIQKPFKMSDYIKPQMIDNEDVEKEASVINNIKDKVGDMADRIVNGKPVVTLTDEITNEFNDGKVTKTKVVKKKYKNGKVKVTKKDFNINTSNNAKNIISKNPKKAALAIGGVALAGLGGKAIYDAQKQKKSQKVAFAILEEAGLVKTASQTDLAVEKVANMLLEEAGFIK